MSPASKEILLDRAKMLHLARMFHVERGVTEVDCPILTAKASVDQHIDLFQIQEGRFLHSSPEYGMKRLLSEGMGDLFQISHVFRKGECGSLHNPEFTLVEWYRLGFTFDEIIDETLDFISLFLGELSHEQITYRQGWNRVVGMDHFDLTKEELIGLWPKSEPFPKSLKKESRDSLLQILFNVLVEPELGKRKLTVLTDYPASQAALARTVWDGDEYVAKRFEIFYRGVELANGYDELSDPEEQRLRFVKANRSRKESLPIDEKFLAALEKGLPDCCGVAVGFDRLMMLRHKKKSLSKVIPFSWDEA